MATAAKASAKVVPIDEAATAPKKTSKMVLVVALAALLGAGGAGAAWFFLAKDDAAADAAQPAKPVPGKPPVFLALEPFTVNLQPEVGEQYLQVGMTLQLADDKQVEMVKLYMPLVRSRILMLLTGKKGSELTVLEGKEKLQAEIADLVRKPFTPNGPEQGVNAVLITSFVIQ